MADRGLYPTGASGPGRVLFAEWAGYYLAHSSQKGQQCPICGHPTGDCVTDTPSS